jgi:cytochrome c556
MVAIAATVLAAPPSPRAAPPKWTDADLEPFFSDARDALVGARPTDQSGALGDEAGKVAPAEVAPFLWSEVVDADALDAEVKGAALRLEQPLANPAVFKEGGHNHCRAEFALLAVLFAIIEEYDGDVRWQRDAGALREAFARASANCQTASDKSYAEAGLRRGDLADVIRGARVGRQAPPPVGKWSTLAERKMLMQRMQRGLQERVNPGLADARSFAQAAADVRHEAEMLAVLAEIIHREDYEYWDDETFQEYSRELGAAAAELSRAAAEENYEAARAAAGRASQACAACHDGYRA